MFLLANILKDANIFRFFHTINQIFSSLLNQTIDIGSFRCLVYKLLTKYTLFSVVLCKNSNGYIFIIIAQLGPLLKWLFFHWRRSYNYYWPNSKHFNLTINRPVIQLFEHDSFVTFFTKQKLVRLTITRKSLW